MATISYAEAVAKARSIISEARLADPGEHYPYKHASVSELVALNPPMGPEGPDDSRARAEDYTSQEIADASEQYIRMQQAYLLEPTQEMLGLYREARDLLVQVRMDHRANRGAPTVVGIRARRAGE